jgi:hypothetical protein
MKGNEADVVQFLKVYPLIDACCFRGVVNAPIGLHERAVLVIAWAKHAAARPERTAHTTTSSLAPGQHMQVCL